MVFVFVHKTDVIKSKSCVDITFSFDSLLDLEASLEIFKSLVVMLLIAFDNTNVMKSQGSINTTFALNFFLDL